MARWSIAAVLLAAFVAKVPSMRGFHLLPDSTWPTVVAGLGREVALPLVELGLGIWLVSGSHPRLSRLSTQGLLVLYAIYHVALILNGRGSATCNCFGPRIPLTHSLMALLTGACLLGSNLLPSNDSEHDTKQS